MLSIRNTCCPLKICRPGSAFIPRVRRGFLYIWQASWKTFSSQCFQWCKQLCQKAGGGLSCCCSMKALLLYWIGAFLLLLAFDQQIGFYSSRLERWILLHSCDLDVWLRPPFLPGVQKRERKLKHASHSGSALTLRNHPLKRDLAEYRGFLEAGRQYRYNT